MELLQLKYFCEAAMKENFSKTAKKFSVPPSDISQTVSRLEKELGVSLFERTANRITLNENGKEFYEYVKPALDQLEEAKDKVSGNSGNSMREIRIQICVCRGIVTKAIENFRKLHPEVSFYISHNPQSDEDFDIIISDVLPHSEFITGHLMMQEEFVIAVHRSNPISSIENLTADDLRKERFITMSENSSMYNMTIRLCHSMGFEPKIAIQSDDPYYVRKYVELGLGIALVPSISWRGLFEKEIVFKKPGILSRNIYAYSNGTYINKITEDFLNILKEIFSGKEEEK